MTTAMFSGSGVVLGVRVVVGDGVWLGTAVSVDVAVIVGVAVAALVGVAVAVSVPAAAIARLVGGTAVSVSSLAFAPLLPSKLEAPNISSSKSTPPPTANKGFRQLLRSRCWIMDWAALTTLWVSGKLLSVAVICAQEASA